MSSESIHNPSTERLMNMVFDKAREESGKDTAYGLSKYLNELFNDEISERSFTRYYDGYILGRKSERTSPEEFILNKLSEYIGHENYFEFEKAYYVENENNNLKIQLHELRIKFRNYLSLGLIIVITMTVISILFIAKYYQKNCMIWVEDHYEKIRCSGLEREKKLDEVILNEFRKVDVCKDSIFFENGQPRIHYIRHSNTIEFFTHQGEHPYIKGKFTNPITQTIINSRVKPCDSL